jgi:hypothetical protein
MKQGFVNKDKFPETTTPDFLQKESDWLKENRPILETMVRRTAGEEGHGAPYVSETLCIEDLPQLSSVEVIDFLIGDGIIKPHKVDWGAVGGKGVGVEGKKERIRAAVSDCKEDLLSIYRKYRPTPAPPTSNFLLKGKKWVKDVLLGSEEEKYLASISEALLVSVGQIRTVSKFDVSYDHISTGSTPDNPPAEIEEFKRQSFERVPKVIEWRSRWSLGPLLVSLLGLLEIGIGVALLSIPFMQNVGMAFIFEGGTDIGYGMYSVYKNEFSLKAYGIHKAISLAASAGTACFFGAGAGLSWTRVGAEAAEEFGKLVAKRVGRAIFVGGWNILVDFLLSTARDYCIRNFRSQIKAGIQTVFYQQMQTAFGPGGALEQL